MKSVIGFCLLLALGIGGILVLSYKVAEAGWEQAADVCRQAGTEPDDMVHLRNGHYLCVTPDGRIVART